MKGIRAAAQKFCELHDAEVVEMIPGKKLSKKGEPLPVGYKCVISTGVEDFTFHIYFNRHWYYKYDGTTVSTDSMQLAID